MSFHSQLQSSFVTRLPSEIREAIYLEIWRSLGLRQHIVSHVTFFDDVACEVHLSHWPCTTDFYVGDSVQDEMDALPPSELHSFTGKVLKGIPYRRRVDSEWLDHWACEERLIQCVDESWDSEQDPRPDPEEFGCWCKVKKDGLAKRRDPLALGAYMAMLLSCKLISSECLKSIYRSTTFVFTDAITIQGFFGSCALYPLFRRLPANRMEPPPAFFKHAQHIEISLDREYPRHQRCCWPMEEREEFNEELQRFWSEQGREGRFCDDLEPEVHDAFDFHWLHLDMFSNLRSLKIWISIFSKQLYFSISGMPEGLEAMGVDALRKSLLDLTSVDSVILSAPLSKSLGPEVGWVESITEKKGPKIWKRGDMVALFRKRRERLY